MKRLFGAGVKDKKPQPTLEDATKAVDTRVSGIDEKIKKLDQELLGYKEKMKKTRGPALEALKQRAMRILKQKKMYEQQRDQMSNQVFNMEQTTWATQSLKDTVTTVEAMKSANKELKKAYKKVDINKIEAMQDDLSDLLDQASEVQEVLGRSYGVPEEVDESDLMAELDGLEAEMASEDAAPSYLQDAGPPVETANPANEAKKTDEYGLPAVPQQAI